LLRELIARGKKVSWFEPDLYTQAHYLGLLNFEHVFLDAYINTHVILPTGEIKEADDIVKFSKDWMAIKGSNKIGFNVHMISKRLNFKEIMARSSTTRDGKPMLKNSFINIYNILSITYLIWRQSKQNVMIAKDKTVPKD